MMRQRDELIGRHVFEAVPDNPDDPTADGAAKLRASLERVRDRGEPDAMPVQRYDIRVQGRGRPEERLWTPTHSPVLDAAGNTLFIIQHAEDVTEQHAAQQRLAASERRFRALVEHATDLIVVVAADRTITYQSPAASRLREGPGAPAAPCWGARAHPDDRDAALRLFVRACRAAPGEPVGARLRMATQEDDVRWMDVRATNHLRRPQHRRDRHEPARRHRAARGGGDPEPAGGPGPADRAAEPPLVPGRAHAGRRPGPPQRALPRRPARRRRPLQARERRPRASGRRPPAGRPGRADGGPAPARGPGRPPRRRRVRDPGGGPPARDRRARHRRARGAAAAATGLYRLGPALQSNVTLSIGVDTGSGTLDANTLLAHADAALYEAKRRGRNRIEAFDPAQRQELVRRMHVEHELYRALEEDELDPALAADRPRRRRRGRRRRGAVALGAPRAGAPRCARVPAHRRARRADAADLRMGALPRGGPGSGLAGSARAGDLRQPQRSRARQPVAARRRLGARRRARGRTRARALRDQRAHAHHRARARPASSCTRCASADSALPWTTSAPATRRWPGCRSCRSTCSSSTAASPGPSTARPRRPSSSRSCASRPRWASPPWRRASSPRRSSTCSGASAATTSRASPSDGPSLPPSSPRGSPPARA